MQAVHHFLVTWRAVTRIALALAVIAAGAPIAAADPADVSVDPAGPYTITFQDPAWTFGGDVGRPLTHITTGSGTDRVGPYQETAFDYVDGVPRHAGIRAYRDKPIVLFTLTYLAAGNNTAPFPTLTTTPQNPYHLAYSGIFGSYTFGGLASDSPWLFFDSAANAFLLSPASDFLITSTTRGGTGAISTGILPTISNLPAGFTHQTLLVAHKGINATFEIWGQAMTDLQGKVRPANDADLGLNTLGYWTDNGATYYYHFESALGYAGTLLAVRDDFARQGIPLGYMQLDSWFYPKGPQQDWHDSSSGIWQYVAAPALFPNGLPAFQQQLGLPLITHARWIDPSSPYRQQYQMSGNVSIDPLYWDTITAYIHDAGVVTYEQDWLGAQAQPVYNLTDPEAFLDNMARACQERGLTMQYCMPLPRHYLQSSRYSNLTTTRVSNDRFNRNQWNDFFYASRLASALGEWPFTDVFMSSETDNLLLATLSAGLVGIGDRIGALNRDNLFQAVRNDGVIVKPDLPIVPVDASFIQDAQGLTHPLVASTYSDFGGLKSVYVFAFNRGTDMTTTFTPASVGLNGPVYLYNYFTDTGRVMDAGDTFREAMTNGTGANRWAYYLVVPVGSSGIAFLGDAGKFVSSGKKRIAQLVDTGTMQATITFAAGEGSVILHGYSPSVPTVIAMKGAVDLPTYDASKQLFRVAVSPDTEGTAVLELAPTATVSGAITLENCVNSVQPLTFMFRPTDGSAPFTRTATLDARGAFRLPDLPRNRYNVWIKGAKWLAKVVVVDASSGNVSGVTATLLAGDANNDNVVSTADYLLLKASFGSMPGDPNWNNGAADFNCDGVVNTSDYLLLKANYGLHGDP